ncbi:hypothetical protein QFZ48_002886 [Chitinophaga sp. W2I13]|uniref:hypothetical protein n=1 Tax=Chitinophaga sp. W2I13 TaxID=3373923 RepID=UPI003D1CF2C5
MGKYDEFLREYLNKKQGLLGSELSELLIEEFNVSPENARKVIQRVTNNKAIWSSKPLSFGKGQYFYFHPDQYPDKFLIKDLAKERRPPLYRLLDLLDINEGVISFHEALKVTSSPEENSTSKVSLLKDIVNDLAKLKVVVERKGENGSNFILYRHQEEGELAELRYKELMTKHQDSLRVDTMFIPDLIRWLAESNIITTWGAYRSSNTPGLGSTHNNLSWDAFAYTKTTGINPGVAVHADKIEKQTLVVMDIVISRTYCMSDLQGFISRIQINNNSVKDAQRKVLPLLIYANIEPHVQNIAKKLGFMIFSMRKVYGANIGKLIEDIKTIYGNLNNDFSESIEAALNKISTSGQTEQLKALRGALFEALMNPVLSTLYPKAQFLPGKILKHPQKDQKREFDYILASSHPKELILVELKGYAGNSYIKLGDSNTKNTLRYFFRSSVPLASEYFKTDMILQNHKIKAVFISTGNYHSECNDFINKINSSSYNPKKIGKCIINGVELLDLLNEEGFEHEAHVIKKYYINEQEDNTDSD